MASFYRFLAQLRRVFAVLALFFILPLWGRAQTVPPGEGLVADTTELRVLRQLYAATNGTEWVHHDNWLTGTTLADAATWYGVALGGGDVTYLYLVGNNLRGQLPASFGELRQLQVLYLSYNALTGPLPASLVRLTALNQCSLESNQLTGGLAGLFDSWAQVQGLSLSHNQLTGPLPPALGGLPRLYSLALDHNGLTGPLPASLGHLQQLWVLSLNDNQLTGPVPGAWGHLQGLRQLFLFNNLLSGPLPDSLALLRDLNYFDAGHNRFTGPIPAAYQRFRALQRLSLADNQLTGTLPDSLNGSYLNLDHNHFSGPLPASYATAPSLSQLTLDGNDLTRLPDFHPSPRWPYQQVTISGNFLEFDSYERNLITPGVYQWFYDYGQRSPAPADPLQVVAGAPASLNGRISGTHNRYQWQRQVSNQWVDIPGETQPDLAWSAVTPAETGDYRTRVTNDWVVNVVLYSRAYPLDVLPYPALLRNRPDDTNYTTALADTVAAPDTHRPAVGDVNYVRTWTPRVALTDSTQVPHASAANVALATTYLDGLGRPVQTVLHHASPLGRDLVQPQAYDALGREPKQYLPYPASPTDDHSPQGYHYRAQADQQAFYYRTGPSSGGIGPLTPGDPIQGVARTGVAFAETKFEASPLNRVVAQGAAGETWQVTNGHVMERTERPNTPADSVLRFVPGYDPTIVDPGYQGFYEPNELWGTDVADAHGPNEVGAHGYRTVEWKDKEGRVVLRQVEANRTGTNAAPQSRWLRTAYAYDDFGYLRYVIQPEGTKQFLAIRNVPAALPASAAPFLFHYRYDGRGRQIAKQVPGTEGETLLVYDVLDRPVLSQDAAQRARKEWAFTKYDALGRTILSGVVTRSDTASRAGLQTLANLASDAMPPYEARTANLTVFPHGYTTDDAFPRLGEEGFSNGPVLSATYYDDYNFDNDAAGTADVFYNTSTDAQFPAGAAPVADALRTTGLTTRTKTRVLGVDPADATQAAWLVTTTFYDERARPVQVQTTNARQDVVTGHQYTDVLTTQLDFMGKVVQSVAVHEGPNHTPVSVAEFFTYDHTGRLLTTRQQLPGEAQPTQIASVSYNEIGQATQKTMGTGQLAQQVDYTYNIRGWLTQLNDPYYPVAGDLFNLSLHYEQGFTRGYEQFNGNLTGQTWRSARDGVQRAYGYVYDPVNRLLQGDFVARNASASATPNILGAWRAEEDNYRLSFASYDDNGNLLSLRRRGLLANATHATAKRFGPVDELRYAYAGNRLQAVDDQVSTNQLPRPLGYEGAPTSLAGDFQEGGTHLGQEYLYDANGNLTQDRNKGITGIAYNHLNLPRQIHFGVGGDSIVFRYTASGQKVAKLVYQTGKLLPQRTDYLGPYQYEDDSLRFFPHAEGRVLRTVNSIGVVRYQREFTFKDHLGNLRLAYRAGQRKVYQAGLEPGDAGRETQQFDSLSVSPPIAVSTGLARTLTHAARLNAGGTAPQPLGPLTQFAVQKGDTVHAIAYGMYPQTVSNNSFAFSLAGFVASLLQPAPANAPPGLDGSRRGGLPLLQVGLNAGSLLPLMQLPDGVPKGYLRVLVFNEDSVLVSQQCVTVPLQAVTTPGYQTLDAQPIILAQNGYVSVYVGNESAADVYFDDVTVTLGQNVQVQETQYDPVGLELAGLGTTTPGLKPLNRYRWNGKEFQPDLGLNWTQLDWRMFDSPLDLMHGVDPEVENGQESMSPYAFGFDNAVRFNDPNGRFPGGVGEMIRDAATYSAGYVGAVADNILGTNSNASNPSAGTRSFQNGARDGNLASFGVGLYLATTGSGQAAAGMGMLATAGVLETATLGAGSPVAGPVAAAGVEHVAVGALKTGAGLWLMKNASRPARRTVDKQHGNSTTSKKGSGSYENTHKSGKTYDGVGSPERMNDSAERVAAENNDPVVGQKYTPAANRKEAYIQEHLSMEANGGAGNTARNYNVSKSPGAKLLDKK